MKKNVKYVIALLLAIVLVSGLVFWSSRAKTESSGAELWENATYLTDMELGDGSKAVSVEVTAEGKAVRFLVHTDNDTVGAALLEQGLIAGEDGEYGLYVKEVNGITADYDVDQSYWAFYVNGEYAMAGVDQTEISEEAEYQLAYAK